MTDVIDVSDDELSVITEEGEYSELEIAFVEEDKSGGEDDVLFSLGVLDEIASGETGRGDQEEPELFVSIEEVEEPDPASLVLDARLGEMTNQNHELRNKVRSLEEELEVKEMEFSSRLLEESNRARAAFAERQNGAELEHQVSKLEAGLVFERERNQESRAEVNRLREELSERRESQSRAEDSVISLNEELESVTGVQERLNDQVESLKAKVFELHEELSNEAGRRREAQAEISSTLEALDQLTRRSKTVE